MPVTGAFPGQMGPFILSSTSAAGVPAATPSLTLL